MAKKSLANQTLKKKSMLHKVANLSGEFQHEVTQEMVEESKVSELPDDVKKGIQYLPDEKLLDDPLNKEYYSDLEVEQLSLTMKKYGFQGVILAYPCGDDTYMIESGHRRRLAGRQAGLTEFPVLLTEPPKHLWERRIRLLGANLHGRGEGSPLEKARIAQGLYESHKDEIEFKRKENLLTENEITALNQLVALDMELTDKTVEKYRRLLNLIPELQNMADSGRYPWSYLAEASNLSEEKQNELVRLILEREKKGGNSASNAWIKNIISKLKLNQMAESTEEVVEEKSVSRIRRKNGTKVVIKSAKELHEVLDKDALFKKAELPVVIDTLEGIKKSIEAKIDELSNKI